MLGYSEPWDSTALTQRLLCLASSDRATGELLQRRCRDEAPVVAVLGDEVVGASPGPVVDGHRVSRGGRGAWPGCCPSPESRQLDVSLHLARILRGRIAISLNPHLSLTVERRGGKSAKKPS